jgi:TolB-like protein/Tfp pilus assembly protein PilF
MATVYLAHDLRHDRPVALKVLHPELAATLGPDRFLREIRIAARLQHPHILPVHDSGEEVDQLWYTMPYVEGESLRDRLKRETQLPVEDAIRLTREVAEALDYAHNQSIVHRDVKPENILLSRGHALVADFGVARALGVAGGDKLTGTGMAVGTPAYMSPEQASGGGVDARSDVYALGCVLYELLAGEPPFTGPTPQAVIAKRFLQPVASLQQLRPTVPAWVDAAVQKSLAQVPADRFISAAEFAEALARTAPVTGSGAPAAPGIGLRTRRGRKLALIVPAAVLALTVVAALVARGRVRPVARAHAEPVRLAVLPFENLGRAEDEYFTDGMTDEIRGKLAGLSGLRVIASTSTSQYKHATKSPRQIGKELGAEYLLTGRVRWETSSRGPGRVRVSPELIEAANATTKWQQPIDAVLSDVFTVQAEIAERVAQALGVALGAGKREALQERPTENLAAYDAYLKGNQAFGAGARGANIASMRRAIEWYDRAVTLDSTFALAWARLSQGRSALYFLGGSPTEANLPLAKAAAERALRLAPERPEGHLALGDYYAYVHRDWVRAQADYARARARTQNSAEVLASLAEVERAQGRWEAALAHVRGAAELDPLSESHADATALALLFLRRYREALGAADRAMHLAPESPVVHHLKIMSHLGQGDLAGARAVLEAAAREVEPSTLVAYLATYFDLYWVLDSVQQELLLRLTPAAFGDDTVAWGLAVASTWHLRGEEVRTRAYADTARAAAKTLLFEVPDHPQLRVLLGLAHAFLGRKPQALREGERGVALLPVSKDGYEGAYLQHQLARIHILVGEPDKALDRLEPLLKMPYYLSLGWLRIDPTFNPLRQHPRFRRLVEGTE